MSRRKTAPAPVRWRIRVLAVLVVVAAPLSVDWIAGYLTYHFGDYRERTTGIFRTGVDPTGTRRPDRDYHHGFAPKRVATETWGPQPYTFVTNSLGFKDQTPRDVPLQSARRRLMFVGDSYTEGVGFPYAQTWVGLVDRALADQDIEVLNGGVASYCPKTVYYKVKALLDGGLHVDHIVFFIDVSDMQDELIFNDFIPANKDADDAWAGRFVKTPYPPTFAQYSLTARTILKRRGQDPWKQAIFTDPHTNERFVFSNFNLEREGWTRGAKPDWLDAAEGSAAYYVTKLAALCATHGIAFEIAIYPWPGEIMFNDAHSRYRDFWLRFSGEQHLMCYDLHDVFLPADPAARQRILAQDFIPNDVHWSAAGHRLVADEWLRQYRQRHPK
jgi:hypothetical protein